VTAQGWLLLAAIVFVLIAVGAARLAYRIARRVIRRASARLVDRAVDAVLFVLLFRWLDKKRQVAPRPRPPVLEGDEVYRACPLSRWQGDAAACRWCNRMLGEDKPRFCGPPCRHVAEANHFFDKATPFVLQRDHFTCQHCGRGEGPGHGLEVNHRTPIRGRHKVPGCHHHLEPGPDGRGGLETLGHSCHLAVTAGQRARGWAS
jgi:hypothetical protein